MDRNESFVQSPFKPDRFDGRLWQEMCVRIESEGVDAWLDDQMMRETQWHDIALLCGKSTEITEEILSIQEPKK